MDVEVAARILMNPDGRTNGERLSAAMAMVQEIHTIRPPLTEFVTPEYILALDCLGGLTPWANGLCWAIIHIAEADLKAREALKQAMITLADPASVWIERDRAARIIKSAMDCNHETDVSVQWLMNQTIAADDSLDHLAECYERDCRENANGSGWHEGPHIVYDDRDRLVLMLHETGRRLRAAEMAICNTFDMSKDERNALIDSFVDDVEYLHGDEAP